MVLALVAFSFLLTVKSLPRVEWLYGTVAALLGGRAISAGSASCRAIELMGCGTLAAFVLAGVGVLVQRHQGGDCARGWDCEPLRYEFPFFHSSIAVALFALALRVELSSVGRSPPTATVGSPCRWRYFA